MQEILIIGYLGREPELKYSPQGAVVSQFSVASTERWKDRNGESQERTEWFAIKAFGRRAEIAGEYLHKGSRVYLEGRKRTESWEDKRTGGKNYRDLVYLDRIEFLDSRAKRQWESWAMRPATSEAQFQKRSAVLNAIGFLSRSTRPDR